MPGATLPKVASPVGADFDDGLGVSATVEELSTVFLPVDFIAVVLSLPKISLAHISPVSSLDMGILAYSSTLAMAATCESCRLLYAFCAY